MNTQRAANLMALSIEAARDGHMAEAFGLFLEGYAQMPPEAPDIATAAGNCQHISKAIEDAATRECNYGFECAAEELVGLPACAPNTDCPSQGKTASAPMADDVEDAPQAQNDVTTSPPTPADAAPSSGGGETAAAGPSLRTLFRRLAGTA